MLLTPPSVTPLPLRGFSVDFFFPRPLIINYRALLPAPEAGLAGNEPGPIRKDLRLGLFMEGEGGGGGGWWGGRGVVGGADLHPAGGVNGSSRGAVSRKIRQPLLDSSAKESQLMTGDGSRAHVLPVTWWCFASLTDPLDIRTKRRSLTSCSVASVTECSASHCTVSQCRKIKEETFWELG